MAHISFQKTCQLRYLLPLSIGVLLTVGLVLTHFAAMEARNGSAETFFRQHIQDSTAIARYMQQGYIATLPAALSARHIVQASIPVWNMSSTVASLGYMLRSLAATYADQRLTIVASAVLSQHQRAAYETWLSSVCGPVLNKSYVSLRSITDPASAQPLPPSSNGYYPIITDAAVSGVSGGTEAADLEECVFKGLDFSVSFSRLQRMVDIFDSGRIAWQAPSGAVGAPSGQLNFGYVIPVHARTEEEAGEAGKTHAAFMASRPDIVATLPWTCNRNTTPPAHQACGLGSRAVGVIGTPVYPMTPLERLALAVPAARSSHVSLLYVPPHLVHLIQLDGRDVPRGVTPRLQGRAVLPLPDSVYLQDSYTQQTSWMIRHGSLRPLLSSLSPQELLLSVVHDPSSPSDAPGSYFDWRSLPAAETLSTAMDADRDIAYLQSASAFVLGPHAYVWIIRDRQGLQNREFLQSQQLAWTIGGLLSGLIAVLLPSLLGLIIRQQRRYHSMQLAVVQSEKDGVVQAVAFAAHEIRNPMHGVLASLETGLEDLQPLIRLFQKTLSAVSTTTSALTQQPNSMRADDGELVDSSALQGELLRVMGQYGCSTVLTALEDVAIAQRSAESCHRLVNDMVEYSKLQRGVMSIQKEYMDVRSGLRAALNAQRSFLNASVRTFLGIHSDVPRTLFTDQVRILQVIANGLINAGKFTLTGEIYLTCMLLDTGDIPSLRLPCNPSRKWIVFSTCDTGKGLAGIDIDSLFEPFKGSVDSHGDNKSFARPAVARAWAWLSAWFTSAQTAKEPVNGQVSWPRLGSGSSESVRAAPLVVHTPANRAVAPSSVAKTRGSGLGLPVARLMARALGGDVDLYTESNSPMGKPLTVFIFVLPMSSMHDDASGACPTVYPLFGRSGLLTAPQRQAFRTGVRSLLGHIRHSFPLLEELSVRESRSERPVDRDTDNSSAREHSLSLGRSSVGSNRAATYQQMFGDRAVPLDGQKHVHAARIRSSASSVPSVRHVEDVVVDIQRHDELSTLASVKTAGRAQAEHSSASTTHGAALPREESAEQYHGARSSSKRGDWPRSVGDDNSAREPLHSEREGESDNDQTPVPDTGRRASLALKVDLSQIDRSSSLEDIVTAAPAVASALPAPRVLRVLYAEDDSTNKRLMERMLGKIAVMTPRHSPNRACQASSSPQSTAATMHVTSVADGWEALLACYESGHIDEDILQLAKTELGLTDVEIPAEMKAGRNAAFDVILLDIEMPAASGDQVASYIRRARAQGAPLLAPAWVPIVAVTGRANGLDVRAAFLQGRPIDGLTAYGVTVVMDLPDPYLNAVFDGALGKPFKAVQLLSLVSLVGDASPRLVQAATDSMRMVEQVTPVSPQ